jgi:multiple sugar transport system substrate-binding protein
MEHFGRYGAGYYGIPLMYAPQMLYYRKDLFQDIALGVRYEKLWGAPLRPPRHFEEFNRVAEFFTTQVEEIAYGISVPAAYPECLAPELYMRLKAYGGSVVDTRGRVVLDQPATRKAYENLLQALKCAKPDFRAATDVSAVEDFLRGETAMLITYPAFLTDAADLRKNNHIGSIGCTHIPGKRPLLGGWSLGISSRCDRAGEAAAFLNWACTEQMANYFSMLGCYSAASSAYSNDELVNLYPWLPLYKEIYPYTSPMLPRISAGGRVISPNDIDAMVCRGFYRLLEENCPIDMVLSQTQRALEMLLGGK